MLHLSVEIVPFPVHTCVWKYSTLISTWYQSLSYPHYIVKSSIRDTNPHITPPPKRDPHRREDTSESLLLNIFLSVLCFLTFVTTFSFFSDLLLLLLRDLDELSLATTVASGSASIRRW